MKPVILILFCNALYAQKATLSKAESLLNDGKWPDAIATFEECIRHDEKNLALRYSYGKALLSFGDYSKALLHLDYVYKVKPNFAKDIGFVRARSLHLSGKYAEAAAAFRLLKNEISPVSIEYRLIDKHISQCRLAETLVKKPIDVDIINLDINSPYSEFGSVITTDNSMLYFTSSRPGAAEDLSNKKIIYREDVYQSTINNGLYSTPTNIGPPINSTELDASIGLSTDGNTMYLYRSVGNQGDVFISSLNEKGWKIPEPLTQINSPYWEPSVCEAVGGKVLIYASEKPGGLGGRDLYITSQRKDGSWYTRNIGPEINSPFNEDAPFLHPDGKTLFFSSDGPNSMGGFDVFKSTLQIDGSWSKPENLGYPINSPADDIYYVMASDGMSAYVSSNRQGGKGLKDIYLIKYKSVNIKNASPTYVFKGNIYDSESNKKLAQTYITIIDNNTLDTIYNKITPGNFIIPLTPNKNYNISIYAEGYLFHSENIFIDSVFYHEHVKDIKLEKVKVGSKTILNNVFFDFDKSTLRKESFVELDGIVKLLKENVKLRVGIYGHTDNRGSREYNLNLSQERANSVVNYLTQKGIPKDRLIAKGMGETQPIDTNDTAMGRQSNRRIEFVILSD